MQLTKKKLQKTILKEFLVAVIIIFLSSLPYLHDIITIKGEGTVSWLPDIGLEEYLTYTDDKGKKKVHGFSSYRVFLYTFFIHLFAHIGWAGWFFDSRKSYRFALLVPCGLSLYTVLILLFNGKATKFNDPNVKFYITILLSTIFILNFFINYKLKKK